MVCQYRTRVSGVGSENFLLHSGHDHHHELHSLPMPIQVSLILVGLVFYYNLFYVLSSLFQNWFSGIFYRYFVLLHLTYFVMNFH